MSSPEKPPVPQDEVERLAAINERMKEEAWRLLRESLVNLKKKPAENPHIEEPSE